MVGHTAFFKGLIRIWSIAAVVAPLFPLYWLYYVRVIGCGDSCLCPAAFKQIIYLYIICVTLGSGVSQIITNQTVQKVIRCIYISSLLTNSEIPDCGFSILEMSVL